MMGTFYINCDASRWNVAFEDTTWLLCFHEWSNSVIPTFQVAEQGNSVLRHLKGMLSYSNEVNFRTYLLLFLWFRNTLHLLKIRDPQNDIEKRMVPLVKVYSKAK